MSAIQGAILLVAAIGAAWVFTRHAPILGDRELFWTAVERWAYGNRVAAKYRNLARRQNRAIDAAVAVAEQEG